VKGRMAAIDPVLLTSEEKVGMQRQRKKAEAQPEIKRAYHGVWGLSHYESASAARYIPTPAA